MIQDRTNFAQILSLIALIGVVLTPPEVDGTGRMVLVVASTFALLILALDQRIPGRFLWGGLAGILWLVWHSLLISIDPYRSIEFAEILWCYYCLFGVFYYTPQRNRLAPVLLLLSAAVSGYGVYEFLSASQGLAPGLLVEGVASTRIMSTFAMPGTLWGFLLLVLPLHFMLWNRSGPLIRGGLVIGIALSLGACLLTRSYGIAAGLATILAAWLMFKHGRPGLRNLVGISAIGILLLLSAGIYATRTGGYNPVTLRLQNWLTAVEILAGYPFGAGLNNYAVAYLQHQQVGANESQYAHNTVLQFVAETGIFGIALGIIAAAWFVKHRKRLLGSIDANKPIAVALSVWAVHNLIDIDIYFASVGAVGVVLLATLCSPSANTLSVSHPRPSRWLTASIGTAAVAIVLSSGSIFVSGELLRKAQTDLGYLRVAEAHQILETAARINPFNSSILHEGGQVALEMYHTTREVKYLEASVEYFQNAVRLSPNKVGPRLGLALVRSTSGRRGEAIEEVALAQAMNPYSRYVNSVRRLIESQPAGLPPASEDAPSEETLPSGE